MVLGVGDDAGGVDVCHATTATFTVTLNAASCEVVTPVAPTRRGGVSGGVLEPPTLVLAETDGITYSADPEGPYAAGSR